MRLEAIDEADAQHRPAARLDHVAPKRLSRAAGARARSARGFSPISPRSRRRPTWLPPARFSRQRDWIRWLFLNAGSFALAAEPCAVRTKTRLAEYSFVEDKETGEHEAPASRRPEDRHLQGPPGPDAEGRLEARVHPREFLNLDAGSRIRGVSDSVVRHSLGRWRRTRAQRSRFIVTILAAAASATCAAPPLTAQGWGQLRIGMRERTPGRRHFPSSAPATNRRTRASDARRAAPPKKSPPANSKAATRPAHVQPLRRPTWPPS